jgi:DNA-binding transcriptional regulator YiaG
MELYHYKDCGLPNVWLDGVERIDTAYGPGVSIPALEQLHIEIGKAIATAAKQMTGAEVKFLRTELDLSQKTLAGLLDVAENTVRRWEHDEVPIPGPAQRALAGYYLETVNGGTFRELMLKLAETDRIVTSMKLTFGLHNEAWEAEAA